MPVGAGAKAPALVGKYRVPRASAVVSTRKGYAGLALARDKPSASAASRSLRPSAPE